MSPTRRHSNLHDVTRIDPDNCSCTDCTTGTAVPLTAATKNQVAAAAMGLIGNATNQPINMTITSNQTTVHVGNTEHFTIDNGTILRLSQNPPS